MKVFNWVHRRFQHVHSGVTSIQDDKGMERNGKSKVLDIETHALLGHDHEGNVTLDHVLGNWKEGILAIGTLAIGPLDPTTKCELLAKQVNEEDDDNDQEVDYALYHDVNVFDDYDDYDNRSTESSPLMKMALFSHELEKMDDLDVAVDVAVVVADNDDDEGLKVGSESDNFCDGNDDNKDEKECEMKRRVTLADLFLEESVKETKRLSNCKDYFVNGRSSSLKIKPSSNAKVGLSKAKKLLKEELRPIKKLNQFVKRMMKKKIHPDMVEGGRMEKDMEMQPSKAMGIPTPELETAYESASLLLLQDSAV